MAKRIPIPNNLHREDVLVLRDGQRRVVNNYDWEGDIRCTGSVYPRIFRPDGKSWSEPENSCWDVVAIKRKNEKKLQKVRLDKDAAYMVRVANGGSFSPKRILDIAKRLNGGRSLCAWH